MPSYTPVSSISECTNQWPNVPFFKSLNKIVEFEGKKYTIVKKEQINASQFGYILLAIATLILIRS